jgi:predicted aspartyl protease
VIEGYVTHDGVPEIRLSVGGREWRTIVDSGFNGDLEVPDALKVELNPEFYGEVLSILAAEQSVFEKSYLIDFPFDGETHRVEATFVPSDTILLGTGMLRNYLLEIHFPQQTLRLTRVATDH